MSLNVVYNKFVCRKPSENDIRCDKKMQQIFVTAPFGGIWRCEFEKKLVWYASVWQISFSRLYKSKQATQ